MYTPEQENAFEVLRNNIHNFSELHVDKLPEHMVETNYVAFCTSCIYKEHLPKENWWHWNQSNSKVEKMFNNTRVVLQKFNTRRKNPSQETRKISYKLWLYSIYNHDGQYLASFIWCERGIDRVTPNNLEMDHLSFLRDFVDENVASEFGWANQNRLLPNIYQTNFISDFPPLHSSSSPSQQQHQQSNFQYPVPSSSPSLQINQLSMMNNPQTQPPTSSSPPSSSPPQTGLSNQMPMLSSSPSAPFTSQFAQRSHATNQYVNYTYNVNNVNNVNNLSYPVNHAAFNQPPPNQYTPSFPSNPPHFSPSFPVNTNQQPYYYNQQNSNVNHSPNQNFAPFPTPNQRNQFM